MTIRCTKCNTEVPEGTAVCPACGSASLKEVNEATEDQKIKGKKMGIIFGAILAAILVYCIFSIVSTINAGITIG